MALKDAAESLRTFLGTLPVGLAGRLARTVEADRLKDGFSLPHDFVLDSLRPALRDAGAGRAPTPMRLFCRPFEDLLTDEPRARKQKGRIARASIVPVWNWLAQEAIPAALNAYSLAVKSAALGCGADDPAIRTVEFWRTAGAAIRARLTTEAGRRAVRQSLAGDDATVEDARDMAAMLRAGPEVCDLQAHFPRTMPELTGEAVQAFRQTYARLAEAAPDIAPYLPLVAMGRLERPWEALRLSLAPAGAANEGPGGAGMALAGEVLFDIVDAHGAAIRAARPEFIDPNALAAHVERFTALAGGAIGELRRWPGNAWSERLIRDRAAVAEAMGGLMERAPAEVAAALPLRESSADSGVPTLPDTSNDPDPEKSDRALRYATLIAGCRGCAGAAAFGPSLKRADEEVAAALKRYNEGIVRQLRTAADDARDVAERYAAIATELTAILFSPEEGEYQRRRGGATHDSFVAA